MPPLALAQPARGFGVVSGLTGHATVARAQQPHAALQFRDDVFARDRISTAEHALLRLLLGTEAMVTVRELSVLELLEEGEGAVAHLRSGRIGVSVVARRTQGPAPLALRSPNALAAVRGTVVIADVTHVGKPARVRTTFYVRSGRIEVVALGRPRMTPVSVSAGQTVSVVDSLVGPVRPVTAQQERQLLAGLSSNTPQHAGPPDAAVDLAVEHGRAGLGAATPGVPRSGGTTFPERPLVPALPPPPARPFGSAP